MQSNWAGVAAAAAKGVCCVLFFAASAHAVTITVNSLADDVFPDGAGALFDFAGVPLLPPVSPKCTLRMAVAAANLDFQVGGTFGCAAGSGADVIVFDGALNLAATPGTITLQSKAMSEAPATYASPNTAALAVSRPLTITGPGATQLTLDAKNLGNDSRRILVIGDGVDNTDFNFKMTGVRLYRGRVTDMSAGCMFSAESLELDDVIFSYCESIGGGTNNGFGGALGAGSVLAATVAPTITISNTRFFGNRALRGDGPGRPDNGGAFFGSGTRKVADVTLTNVLFNGNSAERNGGMLIQNAANVLISASHFVSNAATGVDGGNGGGRYGGFLVNGVSGNVTINNFTRVNGNVANEERGGFGVLSVGGTVTLESSEVTGNFVNRGRIGGFEVLTDTFTGTACNGAQLRPVIINDMRILGNSVATNIGGFRVTCSGALTMTDTRVAFNRARGYRTDQTDVVASGLSAGFIGQATDATAAQSTATLTRVIVQGNQTRVTGAGGGGFNVMTAFGLGSFTADGLRVIDNSAASGNGGLTLNGRGAGRTHLVVNSEFSGNSAPSASALFIETDGNYTLRNSTMSANQAVSFGGTIGMNANTNTAGGISLAIENSTIARNTAGSAEILFVGVFANQPNPAVITNTLFTGANTAITIRNSILGPRTTGFTGTNTLGIDPSVTNVTATNSLLEWTGGAPGTFCSGAGMKCNIGSLVAPISENGGTALTRTMALMAGSPAINAGGAVLGGLTTDQRGTGFARVIGSAVDMGAYEADPATLTGCTLDIDGNGSLDALSDGLMTIRAMFGLTGTSVTNNALGANPGRPNWTAIRNYLNANCGSNFAP